MKRVIAVMICACMLAPTLSACEKKADEQPAAQEAVVQETAEEAETVSEETEENTTALTERSLDDLTIETIERPQLFSASENANLEAGLVPMVPSYTVEPDFSNVINPEEIEYAKDAFKQKLAENLFVVGDENGREFYETYEFNAYSQTPNFVTVDSLMHTYHLYFAHLLKTIEKSYLYDELKILSTEMFDKSVMISDTCKGSDFESAADRNVAYFAVACKLLGVDVDVPDFAQADVKTETENIMSAQEITDSPISGNLEDYSQYKPRGYYENDETLQEYFRAMMWYGRINFDQNIDDMNKSALLLTLALDETAKEEWESIYAVTSFFAGASDDLGYCEYMAVARAVYGDNIDVKTVIEDKEGFAAFTGEISKLSAPQIQSIPVFEDEENVIKGYRLMGQRFTIDGSIMQNLIYRAVEQNDNGQMRMLPDVLDVPAALGSAAAEEIVKTAENNAFPDYEINLNKLRENFDNSDAMLWKSSLYSGWLNTLRPLLIPKGEGYPSFMQSQEWTKKTLETFAGSYTELKHDTVLYAKQPMAEMGGGDMEDLDDRGYVEPEPVVYARFADLADATAQGLKKYKMISDEDVKNLGLLSELSNKLLIISQKELKNELCTDEEYELIRDYGGNIEHFWYIAMRAESEDEYFTSEEYPAALVVDVATDPNGYVLEAGCGNPREITVVVPVDGKLRIATGSVYNFYEFTWPLSDRLTDSAWREMIGAMPGEGYLYNRDESMVNPDWTLSYREDRWQPFEW